MLAKNHGLDEKKTRLCVIDTATGKLLYYTDFFKWFKRSVTVVSPKPSSSHYEVVPKTPIEGTGLRITSCMEFRFNLIIEAKGILENSANGN